ncbi:cytochrome P450 [Streptomyces tagetis]|uniref:Cytochrome P450 n=1 Tax=Streptomyces tagetis TaxID=2820809 RepID=A0A940XCE0_9ACTN|nr:cytochrome P450 [Streptomyces sp. RG38]MBQ0825601.1 cytochrome P450 [Streptomyces sp. RG38]
MADGSAPEPVLPFSCPHVLGEPEAFPALRSRPAPVRLPTSTGDTAWLVSTYEGVRAMCGDPRLGRTHPDPAHAPRLWDAALMEPVDGHADEPDDHRRWRHTLARHFGSRHTARLRPAVEERFASLAAPLLRAGPPLDVHADLARPLAAAVICELLGLPEELRPALLDWSDTVRTYGQAAEAAERRARLLDAVRAALDEGRGRPADGTVLTALAHAEPGPRELRADEHADALLDVFLAGFDTVASRMVYGTCHLLAHPGQWRALGRDPALVPGAVEEILRLAVPGGSWIPRYARADIPLPDAPIRAGDLIVLSFQSANRDAAVLADPARFDIRRDPNPHLAFGHGTFYCLGAALTRLELSVFLTGLARFPGLRPAGPLPTLPDLDTGRVTGGLGRLPVTWETGTG